MLDLFFLITPISTIYFFYDLDVRVEQGILLVLTPSISLFSKFRRMAMAFYFENAASLVIKEQEIRSSSLNRHRRSIFEQDYTNEVENIQNKHFPRWMKFVVFTTNSMFSCFMLIVFIFHIATFHEGTGDCVDTFGNKYTVIYEGCKLHVPFCKDMFKASCDCAVLDVKKHNITEVPKQISTLKSLQKLAIQSGPLRLLPNKEMQTLENLRTLNLQFNDLIAFDVDISNWNYITTIWLGYNQIKSTHKSLWKHKGLKNLDISSNEGLKIPEDPKNIHLPSLRYFNAGNNSVNITSILGAEQLPKVIFLILDGNIIPKFPETFSTLKKTVTTLGVARCDLLSLPSAINQFDKLIYIDARNNSISSNDIEFSNTVKEKYFSGNPVCENNNVDLVCEKLCTEYCYSRHHKNKFCDDSCNSEKCEYDGGDCT
jgi:hypothetical protein